LGQFLSSFGPSSVNSRSRITEMHNPFTDDIFAGELPDERWPVHGGALKALEEVMPGLPGGAMGRALILSAPRAGFGKTHLVTRFAAGLLGRAFVAPLTFDPEKPPRWQSVLMDLVEKLHRDHGHRPGVTLLDETARFLFARANQRLIAERKVPCAHPAEAVAALERNYLEMFDFTNPSQQVAKWFAEHFEGLVALTSASLASEAGVDGASAGFWLRVLCGYAQAAGEPAGRRFESLRWAINTPEGPAVAGAGGFSIIQESGSPELAAKERLRDFGRLLGLYRPVVFIIDHVDVFYRDGQAGLRIAYFISELRRLIPRSLTVLSVNQDVWEATFRSQLPSALEDRLTGGFIHLPGLSLVQAEGLIESRLSASGEPRAASAAFCERLRLADFFAGHAGRPVSPRAVLRYAAEKWRLAQPGGGPTEPGPRIESAGGSEPLAFPEMGAGAAEPSTTSVLGDDTLDSITAAIEAMAAEVAAPVAPAAEPAGAASPIASEPKGAFQQLKERLERVRQPRAPQAQREATANGDTVRSGPLATAFTQFLRRRSGSPVAPPLDLERLGPLLRFAGQHFPVVRAAELNVPGTRGSAVQWLSPDAEIIVGLEPATRPTFWSALTAHAAARARLNGGLPVKVVAFSERTSSTHPAAQGGAAGGFALDLFEPTASDLVVLAASGDILDQVEAGTLTAEPPEIAALLAQELESFWRRLTRLAPVGESG
jgi:hypothetical protein